MSALQPLPNNPYTTRTPAHWAYATFITLENNFPLVNWLGPPTIVCARLLGYLIIHTPSAGGHTCITNEINSCNNDKQKLHLLAQFYINNFLSICEQLITYPEFINQIVRQNKSHTPHHSGHVSRPEQNQNLLIGWYSISQLILYGVPAGWQI